MATIVRLGDVEFRDFEIPEQLPFGGLQRIVTHYFPGVGAAHQAMGFENRPPEWSGIFLGREALARARLLERMVRDGKPVLLTWHDFILSVLVERFEADFQAHYEIPYTIACRVVADRSDEFEGPPQMTREAAIVDDMQTVRRVLPRVPDDLLAGHIDEMDAAIAAINEVARATAAQVQAITKPLTLAQRRLNFLASSYANIIRNATALGGVLPGNPVDVMSNTVLGHMGAVVGLANIQVIDASLGRVARNVAQVDPAANALQTVVAGGTLYDVAAEQYGDATQWERIARANGMTDPTIDGIQTLNIPYDAGG